MELDTVMTANPATCSRETPLREVARLMAANDCGMIPMVDPQGLPVGVVTDRDIALRAVADGKGGDGCCAGDVMSSSVRSVPMDTSLADCCAAMESAQVRRLPVLDAQGRVCGIIAQADIALDGNADRTAQVVRQVSKPA